MIEDNEKMISILYRIFTVLSIFALSFRIIPLLPSQRELLFDPAIYRETF